MFCWFFIVLQPEKYVFVEFLDFFWINVEKYNSDVQKHSSNVSVATSCKCFRKKTNHTRWRCKNVIVTSENLENKYFVGFQ